MSGKNHTVRFLKLNGLKYQEEKKIVQASGDLSRSDRTLANNELKSKI
jgi:hypothetical protein